MAGRMRAVVTLAFLVGCSSCLAADDPKEATRTDVAAALKKIDAGNRDEKLAALGLLSRVAVEEKLGTHKSATVTLCVQLLHDKDREIGNAACDVLSWLDADAIPALAEALQSNDPFVQSTAARAIGSIARIRKPPAARTDAAIPPLVKLLRSEEKSTRHNAFNALAELGPRAIPHMIDALDAEFDYQWILMKGFLRHGEKSVEPLCQALRRGNVATRRNAAFMLFHISWQAPDVLPVLESKALTPLTEAIDDEDPQVRSRAIDTLGRMESRAKPALDKIIAALAQPDAPLGSIAAAARQIGPEVKHLDALFDGAERMFAAATSTNDRERAAAAFGEAIGAAGEPAVGRVVQALDDRRETVRGTAMWALFYLGPKAAPAVPAVIRELNGGHRVAPAVLGAVGAQAKDAVPHLVRRLEHDEWLLSRQVFSITHYSACAKALAAIGRPAIPALLEGLTHKTDLVRLGCVMALEEMDAQAMVPLLAIEPLCRDEHPLVRAHAMLALVRHRLAKEQLLPILTRLQDDSHRGVAAAARQELTRLQQD